MAEKKAECRISIAGVLGILLILVLAAVNFRLAVPPVLQFLHRQTDFRQMTSNTSEAYVSDGFVPKDLCLTLNGFFARITGRRVYNEVTLMKNGMLTHESAGRRNMEGPAEIISSLASFAEEQSGSRFLFVAPPYKVPLEGDLLPAGRTNHRNANLDELLQRLEDAGLASLDLRPSFSANQALIEKYMYRTDHHWTSDAATEAFGLIMNRLEILLGEELDKTYTDLSLWERHEEKNYWIGSHGKRVGPLFAGTDSMIFHTPRFETGLSYAYNHTDNRIGFSKGDYTSIYVFDREFTRGDWYNVNCNQVYMYELFPLVIHRNPNAPNKQRIMMVGDSYCRGMQTFLATEFAEVHMIDTRYESNFTLAQYAAWTRPDVLLIMTSTLGDNFIYDFGVSSEKEWVETHPGRATLLQEESFEEIPQNSGENAVELPVSFLPGEVYHLSFRGVETRGEPTDCATAVLYDKNAGEAVWSAVFDLEYGNQTESFRFDFSVPKDHPEAEYVLLLCPGLWEQTPETAMTFSGVSLEQEV